MPNRDKTGPNGKGSKTGRQMGDCEGAIPQLGFGECKPCCRCCGRGRRFQKQIE